MTTQDKIDRIIAVISDWESQDKSDFLAELLDQYMSSEQLDAILAEPSFAPPKRKSQLVGIVEDEDLLRADYTHDEYLELVLCQVRNQDVTITGEDAEGFYNVTLPNGYKIVGLSDKYLVDFQ